MEQQKIGHHYFEAISEQDREGMAHLIRHTGEVEDLCAKAKAGEEATFRTSDGVRFRVILGRETSEGHVYEVVYQGRHQ